MTKVWFITGAGSGLGAGVAKAALKAGDKVVAVGRDTAKIERSLAHLTRDSLATVKADVTNAGDVAEAVATATRRFGRVDVLVNNAGFCLLGNFEELEWQEIERQFNTNVYGVMHVLRAVLPVMRKQRSGHVMNISSGGGIMGFSDVAAYCATKFAVEGLTLSVASEIEQFGIKSTVVEPGMFRTDLLADSNVRYTQPSITDYAHEKPVNASWSRINGTQAGDPDKFGEALVKLTALENPPRFFAVGSDVLDIIRDVTELRRRDASAHEALSRSTDF
ncbi:SDR family NAD(P)-dependent oxidoreductase [Burkholderia sp. BCC1993]|uniref:SDR family NAD(P)-dependent oxidoreductase n=1 Tax=Burkholderia sp. BCC1993 TaxID=2817444 RepID=UPI002AAFA394|nr:SDR family NAD(P)-dependent oxidoreductase [Burkholderia sp. BCC1993]